VKERLACRNFYRVAIESGAGDVRFLTGKATLRRLKLPYCPRRHPAQPAAHARIRAIDAPRALAIPGVVAVFTFQIRRPTPTPFPFGSTPGRPGAFLQYPLAHGRCDTWGTVAVVVASSRYVAEDPRRHRGAL